MTQAEAEAAPHRWPHTTDADRGAIPPQPESEPAHDHDDLRTVQAPLKQRYRDHPNRPS